MVGDIHDDVLPGDRAPRRDLDLLQLFRRVSSDRWWLIAPTLLCFVVSAIVVNVIPPRYTAETKILLENQENYLTRSDKADALALPDDEAVQSQVQLVSSRDLARAVIRDLGLQGNPEFDPLAGGIGPITRALVLLGLERDPLRVAPEDRMLENYFDRLTVFPVTKSRVLTVEFESKDADLASRAANTIASQYIEIQANTKREAARNAADSLRTLVASLRAKAADAESKAQVFRSQSGLILGTNNTSITSQQLGDMSLQLAQARSTQADAQAKAKLIRDMVKAGRVAEVSDALNNDAIRRLFDQRAIVQTETAQQSRTLLPGHPRMQELSAQLADLDRQLRMAGEKAARTLDNDARIAASRVDNLNASINSQKQEIGASGSDQIKLNDLDLNARLLKDQLESNTAKYQDAVARENATATPADARVISRAIAPQIPSFPKKLPIIAIATIAGALLSLGILIAREFLSGRALATQENVAELPVAINARGDSESEIEAWDKDAASEPVLSRQEVLHVQPVPVADVVLRPSLPAAIEDSVKAMRDPFLTTLDAILSRKQPDQALRILVCDGDPAAHPGPLAMQLGRALSRSFRAIAIDCADAASLGGESQSVQRLARGGTEEGPGFAELLAGEASFAEVIHRDSLSRLHFVTGVLSPALVARDEDGATNLLDALAQTYDFVVSSGPMLQEAPPSLLVEHADIVVLNIGDHVTDDLMAKAQGFFGDAEEGGPMVLMMRSFLSEEQRAQIGTAA